MFMRTYCLTIQSDACKICPAFGKTCFQAEIAQLVEHTTENCGVASSILALGTLGLAKGSLATKAGSRGRS